MGIRTGTSEGYTIITLLYSSLLFSTLLYSTLLYSSLLFSTLLVLSTPMSPILRFSPFSSPRATITPASAQRQIQLSPAPGLPPPSSKQHKRDQERRGSEPEGYLRSPNLWQGVLALLAGSTQSPDRGSLPGHAPQFDLLFCSLSILCCCSFSFPGHAPQSLRGDPLGQIRANALHAAATRALSAVR